MRPQLFRGKLQILDANKASQLPKIHHGNCNELQFRDGFAPAAKVQKDSTSSSTLGFSLCLCCSLLLLLLDGFLQRPQSIGSQQELYMITSYFIITHRVSNYFPYLVSSCNSLTCCRPWFGLEGFQHTFGPTLSAG